MTEVHYLFMDLRDESTCIVSSQSIEEEFFLNDERVIEILSDPNGLTFWDARKHYAMLGHVNWEKGEASDKRSS